MGPETESRWHAHGTVCQGQEWGGPAERNGAERRLAWEGLDAQDSRISFPRWSCVVPSRAHTPSLVGFCF